MDITKTTIAKVILEVIGKQAFADFYNGMFENYIGHLQEPYPTDEEVLEAICRMI